MSEGVRLIQQGLRSLNYDPGPLDGMYGPKTEAAWDQARAAKGSPKEIVARPTVAAMSYPDQDDMVAFYGPAGHARCTAGKVTLPMPFVLAWDKDVELDKFSCHELLAGPFQSIFDQAFKHFGAKKFSDLRLNLFGGCYNFRAMRGGTRLSIHSWGAAVDLDPERNQLYWGRDKAAFAKEEYNDWWEIVEANGAVSLGRTKNYDWMHFQFARL